MSTGSPGGGIPSGTPTDEWTRHFNDLPPFKHLCGLAWAEPRAVEGLAHVVKFFVRNLGGLTRARTCAGPAREGKSRTPSMYADEKSDEVVVPRKRSNKGRQLPAEGVEGRASPEGNSRQAAVVRTLSRATTSNRFAAVRRCACGVKPRRAPRSNPRRSPVRLQRTPGSRQRAG